MTRSVSLRWLGRGIVNGGNGSIKLKPHFWYQNTIYTLNVPSSTLRLLWRLVLDVAFCSRFHCLLQISWSWDGKCYVWIAKKWCSFTLEVSNKYRLCIRPLHHTVSKNIMIVLKHALEEGINFLRYKQQRMCHLIDNNKKVVTDLVPCSWSMITTARTCHCVLTFHVR